MNIPLRILLVVCAIIFIILSVLFFVVTLDSNVANGTRQDISALGLNPSITFISISLILLIFAIIFLISVFKKGKEKKGVAKFTSIGEVKISLDSIENIALSVIGRFNTIKNPRAYVKKDEDNVSVTIKVLIMPDVNIPTTSNEIQETVKNIIEENTGVVVSDVKIVIEDIYTNTKNLPETFSRLQDE